MEHADQWLTAVKLIGGAIAAIVIGLAGVFTGKKATNQSPGNGALGEVVAATFTERGQMERLTSAMTSVERAVIASTAETSVLIVLLKAEAHRRELEAEVRQALKDRGIIQP